MSHWSGRFKALGRAWILTNGHEVELPDAESVSIWSHGTPRAGLSIAAGDRCGVGLTFDTMDTTRVTRIDVTVPFGERGNSTWGLSLSESLAWLPHEKGHEETTALSGEHSYVINSNVEDRSWSVTAKPVGVPAEWLTDLHLSLHANQPRWPWNTMTVELRHTASSVGLNLDLSLEAVA